MKATVSGVLAETANRAESGQLQFRFESSEIFNLRSSNTPGTVDFTRHLHAKSLKKNPESASGRPRGESNVWPTKQDYHAFAAERCGQNWNRVFYIFSQ